MSFSLERGKTLGIVGESGSGKSVLSRSIMGLLPTQRRASRAAIKFEGDRDRRRSSRKEMRDYWGTQMAMVFQDPMTSLNPVMKIGKQITESIHDHLDVTQGLRQRDRAGAPAVGAASPRPSAGWASTRTSCRAACASA